MELLMWIGAIAYLLVAAFTFWVFGPDIDEEMDWEAVPSAPSIPVRITIGLLWPLVLFSSVVSLLLDKVRGRR